MQKNNKVFVLKNKREFNRTMNIFVTGQSGKVDKRNIRFSTERLVDIKQRQTSGKKIAAEYWPLNEYEADALLSSPAYGKTFVRKDDPEGKLKRATKLVTSADAERSALRSLLESVGLAFDEKLPNEVLKNQYSIYIQALAGTKKIAESTATKIEAKPVDFAKNMKDGILLAKSIFVEKYGYEVPESVSGDLAFYDGLSNPEFDAEAYILAKGVKDTEASKEKVPVKVEEEEEVEPIESLREKYFETLGVNVPTPKKNDAAWIKSKIDK